MLIFNAVFVLLSLQGVMQPSELGSVTLKVNILTYSTSIFIIFWDIYLVLSPTCESFPIIFKNNIQNLQIIDTCYFFLNH